MQGYGAPNQRAEPLFKTLAVSLYFRILYDFLREGEGYPGGHGCPRH